MFVKFTHNIVVAIVHSLSLLHSMRLDEYTTIIYLSVILSLNLWVVPSLGFL